MLHREHGQQRDVDDDRFCQWGFDRAIDGSRHRDTGDEADQVDEDDEEDKVATEAVQQRGNAMHAGNRTLGGHRTAADRALGVAHGRGSFRTGYSAGWMFWLMRNTLSGSYRALISVAARSWPGRWPAPGPGPRPS